MFVRVFAALSIFTGLLLVCSQFCTARTLGTLECMSLSELQASAFEMVDEVSGQRVQILKTQVGTSTQDVSHNVETNNFFTDTVEFGTRAVYLQFHF